MDNDYNKYIGGSPDYKIKQTVTTYKEFKMNEDNINEPDQNIEPGQELNDIVNIQEIQADAEKEVA
jgi:hypothetical protein